MDVRRIDSYMERHFSDEVGDKICQLFVDGDTIIDGPRKEWDLQYLEDRILLQEDLIYSIAENLNIVSHSLAYELTERSSEVDAYARDLYGAIFNSPTGKEIDTAEYLYMMEPEVYYDIAMHIITEHMERAVELLEEFGEIHFDYYCYKMSNKKEEE